MQVTGVFLLSTTYNVENKKIEAAVRRFDTPVAYWHLACFDECGITQDRVSQWTNFDGLTCIQSESCTRIDVAVDGPNSDQVRGFTSPRQAQRFFSAHAPTGNLFRMRHRHTTVANYRVGRRQAVEAWKETTSTHRVA
jgi:hypothetical protein